MAIEASFHHICASIIYNQGFSKALVVGQYSKNIITIYD